MKIEFTQIEEKIKIDAGRIQANYYFSEEWRAEAARIKRTVFDPIAQIFADLGFALEQQTHIFNNKGNLYGRKGDLRMDFLIDGSNLKIEFFQNSTPMDRPDNAGRYQSDKSLYMPYLMRLEMRRCINRVKAHLAENYELQINQVGSRYRDIFHGGITAHEWVLEDIRNTGHYNPDLGCANGIDYLYNSTSGDKQQLKHGQPVYYYDYKGRLCHGVAYYFLNNMWRVVSGRYAVHACGAYELFVDCPSDPRIKNNLNQRFEILSKRILNLKMNKDPLGDKLQAMLEREYPHREKIYLDRDYAREYFNHCGLTYTQIKKGNIQKLRQMIHKKISATDLLSNSFECNRKTKIETFVEGSIEYAYIGCKAHYFSDRDAVTFHKGGRITFASWACKVNVQPILEAFVEWCDLMVGVNSHA